MQLWMIEIIRWKWWQLGRLQFFLENLGSNKHIWRVMRLKLCAPCVRNTLAEVGLDLTNGVSNGKGKGSCFHFFIFSTFFLLFTSHQSPYITIQIKKITTKYFFFIFLYQTFLLFQKRHSYFFFFLLHINQFLLQYQTETKLFTKRTLSMDN